MRQQVGSSSSSSNAYNLQNYFHVHVFRMLFSFIIKKVIQGKLDKAQLAYL